MIKIPLFPAENVDYTRKLFPKTKLHSLKTGYRTKVILRSQVFRHLYILQALPGLSQSDEPVVSGSFFFFFPQEQLNFSIMKSLLRHMKYMLE